MRVLWIDLVSELGGAQYSMLDACRKLPEFGIELAAAVPPGSLFDKLKEAGVEVYPIAPLRASRRGLGLFLSAAKLLRSPSTVRQITSIVQPQIIHANSLVAFVAARKHSAKTPVIWHARDLRMPTILAQTMAPRATRIIAASKTVDEYLARVLHPRDLGRIRVIRNGIDLTRLSPPDRPLARERFNLPQAVPIIGMVAHLIPWKRHDTFIKTAALIHAQIPQAHFAIVGRDLFKEHARLINSLRTQAQEAGLEGVLHWIDNCETAAEIIPAFDVLVHPATGEPFGRVICEAMALGVPVVAAESGGPAYIIEHNVNGLLVRGGESKLLAAAALELLANPERTAHITQAALKRVKSTFTTELVCQGLVKEYKKIIDDIECSKSKDD